MAGVRANVKGDLLIWARESAGFSVAEAAKKAQVAPEKLEAWEVDEAYPTLNQLNNLAKAYKQPISIFYLSKAVPPFNSVRRRNLWILDQWWSARGARTRTTGYCNWPLSPERME